MAPIDTKLQNKIRNQKVAKKSVDIPKSYISHRKLFSPTTESHQTKIRSLESLFYSLRSFFPPPLALFFSTMDTQKLSVRILNELEWVGICCEMVRAELHRNSRFSNSCSSKKSLYNKGQSYINIILYQCEKIGKGRIVILCETGSTYNTFP